MTAPREDEIRRIRSKVHVQGAARRRTLAAAGLGVAMALALAVGLMFARVAWQPVDLPGIGKPGGRDVRLAHV